MQAEAPGGAPTPYYATVELEKPIVRGDQEIRSLRIRKPKSGELRGLKLVELTQFDVNCLHTLLPRIADPLVTPQDVAEMDPADLLACAAEVGGFFLTKRQLREASLET